MKKRALVIGIIAVDTIALIILITVALINANKTAVMDVILAPKTAVMIVNGEEYRQGVYKMFPGKVTAVIRAEGFEEKTVEFELSSEDTTKVYEYLIPLDDNKTYYAKNVDDAEVMAKIGGEEAEEILDIISIRDVLPIISFQYGGLYGESKEIVIDQDLTCEAYFCLGVTGASEAEKEKIDSMIEAKGYNPEDYIIIYER